MCELKQTFLVPPRTTANHDEVVVESIASLERRMEKLFFLGARRISADTLIELASTLSKGKKITSNLTIILSVHL